MSSCYALRYRRFAPDQIGESKPQCFGDLAVALPEGRPACFLSLSRLEHKRTVRRIRNSSELTGILFMVRGNEQQEMATNN